MVKYPTTYVLQIQISRHRQQTNGETAKRQNQQSKRRGKANEAHDVAKVMIDSCGLANANSKQAKVSNWRLL